MFALGIHGKPALDDALALIEEFADTPKAREAHDGRKCPPKETADEEGRQSANDAHEKEYPPRASAEVVFRFDDDGMKNANDKEGAKS